MREADGRSDHAERLNLLHRTLPVPAQIGIGVAVAALTLLAVTRPSWPMVATWRLMPLDLLAVAAAAVGAGLYAGLTAGLIIPLYYLWRFATAVVAGPAVHDLAWLPLLAVASIGIALLGGWPRHLLTTLEDELSGTRRLLEGANRRVANALEAERLRSYYDHVTDLPSRRMVIDRFSQGLSQARRGNTLLAVLLLDLNNFHEVNDRAGHDAGDEVLRQVGQRLLGVMRREDTVGRLDSDTFVVLLTGVTELAGVTIAAEKIADALQEPFLAGSPPGEIRLSAHLGAAIYPQDGRDWESLYRFAQEAIVLAKRPPDHPAADG